MTLRYTCGPCLKGLITAATIYSAQILVAQGQPVQPPLGVFREANKPPSNPLAPLPLSPAQPKPQKPPSHRVEAPLGNPQWQVKKPAESAPQNGQAQSIQSITGSVGGGIGEWGSSVPSINSFKPPRAARIFGAHNFPEPPAPEQAPSTAGLGSIAGIIPDFASTNGFGGGSGPLGGGGAFGGGGIGGGGLAGGALGAGLLGSGMQGLFAGLNPNSIMQIAMGAGMLLSQMGQQQGQGQTSQKPPTPTPSPTVSP